MNDLIGCLKINSFSRILSAYKQAGMENSFHAIDGGAGSGSTSRSIATFLAEGKCVHAFEPFPGNHRFFNKEETNIILHTQALSDKESQMRFRVPSTVDINSEWGRQGMAGYSSVGYLVNDGAESSNDLVVQTCIADDLIGAECEIGFVKLDLQGGELNALKGMTRILKSIRFAWIEFTNQCGLLDFLGDHGFILFDSEYLFDGSPSQDAERDFFISNPHLPLSTGKSAWLGFRRRPWLNYEHEFRNAQSSHGLIQTDLLCVNPLYINEFIKSLPFMLRKT